MSQKKTNKREKKNLELDTPSLPAHSAAILSFLKQKVDQPIANSSLYRYFKDTAPQPVIREALYTLIRQGMVVRRSGGKVSLQQTPTYVVGTVDYVSADYGYVVVGDGQKDVLVKKEDLSSVLDQDQVKVLIVQPGSASRHPVGRVVEVLQRTIKTLFGTLRIEDGNAWVVPTNKRIYQPIVIQPAYLGDAKAGDRVAVDLLHSADLVKGGRLEGKVVQIFGRFGEHVAEMHMIMAEFNLPATFPADVLAVAQVIPATLAPEEISRRKDYRSTFTVTIDPDDAKDFDDALSLQLLPNGHFEVGVHIADVSYYVQDGSAIDQEAFKRGTSVYLVDRTIPMLPERLSNELCSLRPQEDKLTFSAVFELDVQGQLHREWFGETVIHSDRRLTYAQAQAAINDSTADLHQPLQTLHTIASRLRQERFKNGSINFETPTVKFELDPRGKPLSVVPYVSQDSHHLVEEFMLLANKRVALHVQRMRHGKGFPTFVYRAHDRPDFGKLGDFALFVKQFGYTISTDPKTIAPSINQLTEKLLGRPEAPIIQTLAIRLMARACYTTEPKAHFGLAFDHYTHFTSPIRRYPDLMVHRMFKKYLQGSYTFDQATYEKYCQHASDRERVAVEAERASIKYKQVELMQAVKGTAPAWYH